MRERYVTCIDIGCIIGVLIALLAGTAAGLLFANGILLLANFAVWALLGLSVINWALLGAGVYNAAVRGRTVALECLCANMGCITVGIVGTIVSAIALIATGFAVSLISSPILVGLVTFFAIVMIAGDVMLLRCLLNCDEDECCAYDDCMLR
ncbi:MAG: hypothetical protein Q4C12_00845 [Clostridia bacterium]|nr:hypothetical protein [Clostridia bacterium]